MTHEEKRRLEALLCAELREYSTGVLHLPGIQSPEALDSFAHQILDSISRIQYFDAIRCRKISPERKNARSDLFDPISASILYMDEGSIEEAFWLAFLATHFGKNRTSGWRLARDVYGGLGYANPWTWASITNDIEGFRRWSVQFYSVMQNDGIVRKFGNHRKYESMNPRKSNSTMDVIVSYIHWVKKFGSHEELVRHAQQSVGTEAKVLFEYLYKIMKVRRFGRMGKFDYLTMLGKIGLCDIKPGSAYISESTGPRIGCRKLFGNISLLEINNHLDQLEKRMSLGNMGMQVLEDAICNWQKSPSQYVRFRG